MADGHFPTLVSKDRDANSATNPIFSAITDGNDTALVDASGRLSVSVDNTPAVTISGSVTVTATDLDIRDLNSATDSVTVVATDLDIRNLSSATDSVAVTDGGGSLTVDGSVSITGSVTVTATDLDIRDLNSATDSVTVLATNLDIRDLTHATDSVKVGDGTDFLAVNADGSINVVVGGTGGTKVHDHKLASAVAGDSTDNHDYTAAGGTLLIKQVSFASSGGSKAVLILDPTGVNKTIWTGFISKEGGEKHIVFEEPVEVPDTDVIRLAVTNRQGASQDLYSLIEGTQL